MKRIFNFSAGPSMLPLPVLEQVQKELLNCHDTGCSVMEMSHRSKDFEEIITKAEEKLRAVMKVPSNYAVLFLQGGATLQFSAVPYNLAAKGQTASYVLTGEFAQKACKEGKRWLNAEVISSSEDKKFRCIPHITAEMIVPQSKYVHITVNNTIFGTMYNQLPETGNIPLVGDMSSIILGKEYPVEKFGVIYAGAQKNIGPSGLTLVLVRRDLFSEVDLIIPPVLQYAKQDENRSMVNTPPTFAIYVAGLVFEWLSSMGGVSSLQKINEEKAALLYDVLDNSQAFEAPALVQDRSIMNIPFVLKDESRTGDFLKMAERRSLINLKGHRLAGGCRASIYNAMPVEGVRALVECIKDFDSGKTA